MNELKDLAHLSTLSMSAHEVATGIPQENAYKKLY
jgi:hypothetical protein